MMTNQTNPAPATTEASAAVRSRAVHVARAKSVQADGLPCAQALYQKANELNHTWFGGQLTALLVEITAPASPRAYATHQPKTPEGVDCMIRIAPGVVAEGELFANDVLLHEMIHVWQTETGNQEPGYQGHGPKFAAECNRIGASMTPPLPPVGVKGRGGLPDCAQWPLNVRPVGYYGESERVRKAQARGAAKGGKSPKAPAKSKLDKAAALYDAMTDEERGDFQERVGL